MQKGDLCEIVARYFPRCSQGASYLRAELGIPESFTVSYEEMLAGIPRSKPSTIRLPNHLHVPWSIRAAEAGKHVRMREAGGHGFGRGAQADLRRATERES